MNGEQTSIFGGSERYKITKPLRLIELFAGIGAQAKAIENLGRPFEHYRICEFDKYAVQSYNAIHGTNFKPSDITKIHADDLGITETDKYEYIATYSFPCTDLSPAGKQAGMARGSGTRSGLLWEVERLLKECKELPQVLLMENVPKVLNRDFGEWLDFLESKGYKNYYKILNAKNYGIPQNRDRCFMVSVLGDWYYEFPKPICDLFDKPLYWNVEKFITISEANKRKSKPTKRMLSALIGNGIIVDVYNRRRVKIFPTIRASVSKNNDIWYFKNGEWYKPMAIDCWRLMGFKDSDFDKAKASGVSDSQLYKQAGNSIVVPVLEAIINNLF